MLYVSLTPAPAGKASALQRLLADPGIERLLGMGQDARTGTFGLLEGLLRRTPGQIELAVLGIVPGHGEDRVIAGRPLLALRAELAANDAERLRALLSGGEIGRPSRKVGGQPTWQLGDAERAGELVEVAVIGNDLIVANHGEAIDELLGGGTTAARALAVNPRFLLLRQQLAVAPGSLLVYGDWQRLGRRLATAAGGLGGFLVEWSGLGGAEAVMASIASRGEDLVSDILLDFGKREDLDGWLQLAQAAPAKSLVGDLPAGGIGGLVVAVDPTRLGGGIDVATGRLLHFAGLVSHGCQERGLDLQRQVLDRLGRRGSMQLVQPQDGGALVSTYAFEARSRKHARDLFDDVAQAVRHAGAGRVLTEKDSGVEQIDLGSLFDGEATARLGVLDDSVVIGFQPQALTELKDERKVGSRSRARRDAQVLAALQSLGGMEKVSAVFAIDLSPLLAAAQQQKPRAALTGLPAHHVGGIEIMTEASAVRLRIRALSSR